MVFFCFKHSASSDFGTAGFEVRSLPRTQAQNNAHVETKASGEWQRGLGFVSK